METYQEKMEAKKERYSYLADKARTESKEEITK